MTEFDKMRSEQLYCYDTDAVRLSAVHARHLCQKLSTLTPDDADYRPTLEELVPGIPPSSYIMAPFSCDHGNGIKVGEHVFINYDCTFLDGGYIHIGDYAKIGPHCQLYTPQHPKDYLQRRMPCEICHPITIGEDTWLGGGVIVCPGVTIGARCIIAAGSVVTHDIPDDCLAAGNPAQVKRSLKVDLK